MRQNASISTISVCPVCGKGFAKKRRWQTFCSQKCRKQAWLISKRVGAYSDLRNGIDDIKRQLDRIEKALNLEGKNVQR